MNSNFLHTANGDLLARIDTQDDGVQWIYDRSGGLLGRFDPRSGLNGQTYDRSGALFGQGNVLSMLLDPR